MNIDTEIFSLIKKFIILKEFTEQRYSEYVALELLRNDLELENIIIADLMQAVDRTKRIFKVRNHFNLGKLIIDGIENITS